MNKFDEMRIAVKEAETTLEAADKVATSLAKLVSTRLRSVNIEYWSTGPEILSHMKRELKDWDISKGKWRSK